MHNPWYHNYFALELFHNKTPSASISYYCGLHWTSRQNLILFTHNLLRVHVPFLLSMRLTIFCKIVIHSITLFQWYIAEGPKPATRGGVNGSRSKFLRNFKTVGRCPKVTANPQTEISENSYGQAISTPKTQIKTWKQKRENQLKSNLLRHTPVWPV